MRPLLRAVAQLGSSAPLALFFLISPLMAANEAIQVTIDQARIVNLPPNTLTLVIGNSTVADVTMLGDGGKMIIYGKGFGETNFIALDNGGNPLAESTIRVVPGSNALVVQRGFERESYACAPKCMPTVKIGDGSKYFGDVSGQVQARSVEIQTRTGKGPVGAKNGVPPSP